MRGQGWKGHGGAWWELSVDRMQGQVMGALEAAKVKEFGLSPRDSEGLPRSSV